MLEIAPASLKIELRLELHARESLLSRVRAHAILGRTGAGEAVVTATANVEHNLRLRTVREPVHRWCRSTRE